MKALLCFICCILCYKGIAQNTAVQKAVLIDTIPVRQSQNESYALYLPNSYDPQSSSAIVFIFDPAGRGGTGIKPFIPASEKYGLILVSSNNCRNSAYNKNFDIADRWLNDVLSKYNIEPKSIYAAGFSGGSRLASAIGVLTGAFKGVVGCGAAFSSNNGQMPYSSQHFWYAGLIGNKDMNYQEMHRAKNWLDQINLPNTLITYDGEHSWPPADVITRSFDWFYLQDIRLGNSPKDQDFLDDYLAYQLSEAQEHLKRRQLVQSVRQYEMTANSLGPYFDLDSLSEKALELKKTREYKKLVQAHEKVVDQEQEWKVKLVGRLDKESVMSAGNSDFSWWQKEIEKLQSDYIESELEYEQNTGIRIKGWIFVTAIERFDLFMATDEVDKAMYYAQFLSALWPENVFVHFRLAKAYANIGDEEKALSHLEMAIKNGLENRAIILGSTEFEILKSNKRFKELIEQ